MKSSPKRDLTFRVLNEEKIKQIHNASLSLLEYTGLKIEGRRAVEVLCDHGAKQAAGGLIRIPAELVEMALKTVPHSFMLYTREGEPYTTINNDNIYFGTHADQLEILDPISGEARRFLRGDTELMAKVADGLPNIDFILSVGLHSDVPTEIQSQISFIETVKRFHKPINFSTNDVRGLEEILDMAAQVAGDKKTLREKPFLFYYCEPIPPLSHPEASTEKLRISSVNGIPVVYMPYCMMGGTAPMSFAGALAQCNADVLAGLVMCQLFSEGSPYIYGAMPSIMDMHTTVGSYGAPEFALLVAASSEMADFYGIPFYGTAGTTDAKWIDEQAVAEVTMSCFSALLSKANLVHDVGVMDHCISVSPEMVVIANEIIEMLRHFVLGVEVNSDSLALDVIKEVGPGGHYLTHRHTLNNMRAVWYPNVFTRKMKNDNESDVRERARQVVAHLREERRIPLFDPKLADEFDARYHL